MYIDDIHNMTVPQDFEKGENPTINGWDICRRSKALWGGTLESACAKVVIEYMDFDGEEACYQK